MELKFTTKKIFTDITDQVQKAINIIEGFCLVYSTHTTCGIKIMEREKLLLKDLEAALERIAPERGVYAHDDMDKRGVPQNERVNGHSHVKAFFLSTSEIIPVIKGKLALGQWQSILLVELDRLRQRTIHVRCYGTKEAI